MIHTWSFSSTDTPMVDPSTQWLGSGFGHSGSTSKAGASGALRRLRRHVARQIEVRGAEADEHHEKRDGGDRVSIHRTVSVA